MRVKGWHRVFDDTILFPGGRRLTTLRDAGNFIARLPKREHDAPEWQAATVALLPVVEHGGDTMLPRIGIMRAAPASRATGADAAQGSIRSYGKVRLDSQQ